MQPIIAPVAPELIMGELTPDKLLRPTNKGRNNIYTFSAHEAPHTMREVGRLREEAFRAGGGGSGLACDIDEYDLDPLGYKQLVVWNPEAQVIVGGYRYILGSDVVKHPKGTDILATSHMFDYSDEFVRDILPYTIELGRSFVSPDFQSTRFHHLSIFALDNLWDGLGALTVLNPEIQYFFGKVTMYANYNRRCRNLILHFMQRHFHDDRHLVTPKQPLTIDVDPEEMNRLFSAGTLSADYLALKREVRKTGISIPPLFSAYISLSPQLLFLGTAINYEFSEVEETGILIRIDQILEEKKERHINTFQKTSHPAS